MTLPPRIPVVMYHAVGRPNADWIWGDLTCPPSFFADQIACLASRGYRAATLDEVYEVQASSRPLRQRQVVLTFDDGYLDNWVYAYPLLKRAGWHGIVYVNPEFIDPGDTPRLNLEDVWSGRCAETALQSRGFLNWAELEMMDRSGVLRVGCHSMSHTWYPVGPEIEDFHRPGLSTPWLAWNARPDRKAFYLSEEQSGFVPWGTPIHRNGRSLGIRRWFPDPAQTAAIVEHVSKHGGASFFGNDGWREALLSVAREADQGCGRSETDDEQHERFRYEIADALRVLTDRLGHAIDHFCWPGGAYNDTSWDMALAAGIRTITVKRSDAKRWPDLTPEIIRRISDHHHFWLRGRPYTTTDPRLFVHACDRELGIRGARLAVPLHKVLNAAGMVSHKR